MARTLLKTQDELHAWQQPGTWQMIGPRNAVVSCPICTRETELWAYNLTSAGEVSPTFQCPADRCQFSDDLVLHGWEVGASGVAPVVHDVKVIDALEIPDEVPPETPPANPGGVRVTARSGRK